MDLCDNRIFDAMQKEKEKEKLFLVPNREMRRAEARKNRKKGK